MVSVRTLPSSSALNMTIEAVSSSGASIIVTMSCAPWVQMISLTVAPCFLARLLKASDRLTVSLTC
jgi:hypothetical protein